MKIERLTIALILAVIVASRLPWIPFAIVVVASGSMVPTLHPGDLVVCIGRSFIIGDIVLWCSNPLYCVIHRVIDISNGYIVTKGDANPVADPPVPLDSVKAKAVLVVPWWLWLPIAIVVITVYVLGKLGPRLQAVATLYSYHTFSVIVVLTVAIVLLTSQGLPASAYPAYKPPVPYLSWAKFNITSCDIVVRYTYSGWPLKIVNVTIYDSTVPVSLVEVDNETVVMRIFPGSLFSIASNSPHPRVWICLNVIFERSLRVKGCYVIEVPVKLLHIAANGTHIIIVNPNCYPVNVTLKFYSISGKHWSISVVNVTVAGGGILKLKPPEKCFYLDYSYRLLNSTWWGRMRCGQHR